MTERREEGEREWFSRSEWVHQNTTTELTWQGLSVWAIKVCKTKGLAEIEASTV